MDVIHMKAPKGTNTALIEGHTYDVGADGVIKVVSDTHVETLKRHGFVEHFVEEADIEERIAAMEDKDELVSFIEERGGEADNSMSTKKLRRLALEAAKGEED